MNLTSRLACSDTGGAGCNPCQFKKYLADVDGMLKLNQTKDETYNEYKIRIEACELRHDDLCELISDKKYKVKSLKSLRN